MELYPDQITLVRGVSDAFKDGRQAVVMHAPTGFGKTQALAFIARHSSDRGKRVYMTVHRKTLVAQTRAAFGQWGISHSIVAPGHRIDPRDKVYVCSIETLRRRMSKLKGCDTLIVDEAHLACSTTWTEVLDFYKSSGARLIGATATPARLDGKPLGRHFDCIVSSRSMADLINDGRLSDYRIFAPSAPDMSKARIRMGDYVTADVVDAINKAHLVGDAVEHYKKLMPGKRALAFCVSIAESEKTAAMFCSGNIAAEHIDATTPSDKRRAIISRLASGETKVLCSVNLLSEGFDLSAQVGREVPVEGAIFLRPTQSLVLYLQAFGRALRKKPYPAIILDHAGLALKHGLPDEDRFWSLEGKKGKSGSAENAIPLRHCTGCMSIYKSFLPACPLCGKVPEKVERAGPEITDGQLEEIKDVQARRARAMEVGMAKTLEELILVAKKRDYKKGWVANIWCGRSPGERDFNTTIRKVNELWHQVVLESVA